jgi:glycine cleavage system H protein
LTGPEINVPPGLLYSPEHQWLRREADLVRLGVTDYGQEELGDVVYVVLPSVGTRLGVSERLCEIESVKVAFELISPLAGEVVAVNEALFDTPELINNDPYGDGWLVGIRQEPPSRVAAELMDAAAYEAMVRRLRGLAGPEP